MSCGREWYAMLAVRTPRITTALHYLVTADGVYRCIDLDLAAASEAELNAAVLAWFGGHGADDVMPAAPVEQWVLYGELSGSVSHHAADRKFFLDAFPGRRGPRGGLVWVAVNREGQK